MKVAVFSSKPYDQAFLTNANQDHHELVFHEAALKPARAVIAGLKSSQVGYLGLDVYEEEGDLFFEDHSSQLLQDDVFARLLTFPNVIITGHQAFFTREALTAIAETTMNNINGFELGDLARMHRIE